MTKKLSILCISILSIFLFSACGDGEKEAERDEVKEKEQTQEEKKEKDGSQEEQTADKKETSSAAVPAYEELISYMEDTTEGSTKVLFQNNETQKQTFDTITVSLNGYTLVQLNDFHKDFSIPFDDQTNGGVLIASYTIENKGEDAYYMTDFYVNYTGADKFHTNDQDLLPREQQLKTLLSPSNDYLIKAGEKVMGYYAYPFSQTVLDKILAEQTATIHINTPHRVKGDVNSVFGKNGQFVIGLSDEGVSKSEANELFYPDKASYNQMGEKKMLKEQEGLKMRETLGKTAVTLEGYQFTVFTPNEEEAPRFAHFKNGIVLLTTKFQLDNQGDEAISLSSTTSKLTVNNGTQYTLNEGMLLDYSYDDLLQPGKTGEFLQVYVLDQEQYEKIWKDKPFEIAFGPLKNKDAKDISKGHSVNFILPSDK